MIANPPTHEIRTPRFNGGRVAALPNHDSVGAFDVRRANLLSFQPSLRPNEN
jgi:hypothetical protein